MKINGTINPVQAKNNGNTNENKFEKRIRELNDRIATLKTELNTVQVDPSMDADLKKFKIEQINTNISTCELQIQQLRTQQQESKENEKKVAEPTKPAKEDVGDFDAACLTQGALDVDNLKKINQLSSSLKKQANIIKSEIKLDSSRGVDVSKKMEEFNNLNKNINTVTDKLADLMKAHKETNEEDEEKDSNVLDIK